jgi:hypothetical protein
VVFWEKNHAIQSAGMEDGLLDVVVTQLVVHMHNKRKKSALPAPQPQQIFDTSWTMLDPSDTLTWDFGFYE